MQLGDILSLAGLRADGRGYDEIRRLNYKIGGNLDVSGSAYIEQVQVTTTIICFLRVIDEFLIGICGKGLNKVLVSVTGPAEPYRRAADASDEKVFIILPLLLYVSLLYCALFMLFLLYQACIVCHILNAPFSGPDWRKRRMVREH